MNPLYLSRAVLTSYDNESGADAGAGAGASAGAEAGGGGGMDFQGFTPAQQEKVNALLASDRRKHQQKLENTIEEMSSRVSLTVEEKAALEQQLADMRNSAQTVQERLSAEKKATEEKYKKEISQERKQREEWENRYKQGTLERALQDAAVKGDAHNVDVMMSVLRPMTRLVEISDEKTGKGTGKFKAVVDFPDADPDTQEPVTVPHTPESAVKRMKEMPTLYGGLFRSGVTGGVGANSGVQPGKDGKIDVRRLTQEQYMELRAKNPAALGLRAPKGRSGR